MNAIFLVDNYNNDVTGVIIAEKTSRQDIENIIDRLQEDGSDCTWEDLVNSLPEDCQIFGMTCDNTVVW